jgi:hypothetical protein
VPEPLPWRDATSCQKQVRQNIAFQISSLHKVSPVMYLNVVLSLQMWRLHTPVS